MSRPFSSSSFSLLLAIPFSYFPAFLVLPHDSFLGTNGHIQSNKAHIQVRRQVAVSEWKPSEKKNEYEMEFPSSSLFSIVV